MAHTNLDNRLKCDSYGNKAGRETKFFAGKDENGQAKTTTGFKNVITDAEADGPEPPYRAGEAHGFRVTEAYRRGYEQIHWDGGN